MILIHQLFFSTRSFHSIVSNKDDEPLQPSALSQSGHLENECNEDTQNKNATMCKTESKSNDFNKPAFKCLTDITKITGDPHINSNYQNFQKKQNLFYQNHMQNNISDDSTVSKLNQLNHNVNIPRKKPNISPQKSDCLEQGVLSHEAMTGSSVFPSVSRSALHSVTESVSSMYSQILKHTSGFSHSDNVGSDYTIPEYQWSELDEPPQLVIDMEENTTDTATNEECNLPYEHSKETNKPLCLVTHNRSINVPDLQSKPIENNLCNEMDHSEKRNSSSSLNEERCKNKQDSKENNDSTDVSKQKVVLKINLKRSANVSSENKTQKKKKKKKKIAEVVDHDEFSKNSSLKKKVDQVGLPDRFSNATNQTLHGKFGKFLEQNNSERLKLVPQKSCEPQNVFPNYNRNFQYSYEGLNCNTSLYDSHKMNSLPPKKRNFRSQQYGVTLDSCRTLECNVQSVNDNHNFTFIEEMSNSKILESSTQIDFQTKGQQVKFEKGQHLLQIDEKLRNSQTNTENLSIYDKRSVSSEQPVINNSIPIQHFKKFPCSNPSCSATFTRKWSLDMHMKKVHGEENLFTCSYRECSKSFCSRRELKQHISDEHKGQKHKLITNWPKCNMSLENSSNNRVVSSDPVNEKTL